MTLKTIVDNLEYYWDGYTKSNDSSVKENCELWIDKTIEQLRRYSNGDNDTIETGRYDE